MLHNKVDALSVRKLQVGLSGLAAWAMWSPGKCLTSEDDRLLETTDPALTHTEHLE